jgi:D-serine deaminase-like pyridoxal phosphate-dependent protein
VTEATAAYPQPPARLVGAPVADIPTPALLLDLDALERNVAQMAAALGGYPATLRPHVKAHKCAQIARLQLAAGATGLTCATATEVRAFAAAGFPDLLLANQLASMANARILAATAVGCRVTLAVENAAQVALASRAACESDAELGVVIEVDVGAGRGGIREFAELEPLANLVANSRGVRLDGLMGYEGHATGEPDRLKRQTLAHAAINRLGDAYDLLRQAGYEPVLVSAGGTSTFDMTGTDPRVSEIQAGSYAIMDAYHQETTANFEIALTVAATVLSRHGDLVVLDAGRKSLGGDLREPRLASGHAALRFLHEEHSGFEVGGLPVKPGDQLRLVCGYAPTAVNLHGWYYVVRRDVVADVWPIIGRYSAA